MRTGLRTALSALLLGAAVPAFAQVESLPAPTGEGAGLALDAAPGFRRDVEVVLEAAFPLGMTDPLPALERLRSLEASEASAPRKAVYRAALGELAAAAEPPTTHGAAVGTAARVAATARREPSLARALSALRSGLPSAPELGPKPRSVSIETLERLPTVAQGLEVFGRNRRPDAPVAYAGRALESPFASGRVLAGGGRSQPGTTGDDAAVLALPSHGRSGLSALETEKPRRPLPLLVQGAVVVAVLAALIALPLHFNPAAASTLTFHGPRPLVSWAAQGLLASGAAAADLALGFFFVKHIPSKRSGSSGSLGETLKKHPLAVAWHFLFGATVEEFIFRFAMLTVEVMGFAAFLPGAWAYAAAVLCNAFFFAFIHSYGHVWPRVAGGLVYAGLYAVTGSLLAAILAHFLHNYLLYVGLKLGLVSAQTAGVDDPAPKR